MFLIGLLSIAMTLVITGCPAEGNTDPDGNTNDGNTKFEGTWQGSYTYEDEESGEDATILGQYIFRGSNVTSKMKVGDADWTNSAKATFTSTSTQLTLTITHTWDEGAWVSVDEEDSETLNYSIDGNTLTLSYPDDPEDSLILTKQ
ncbi:hypothetical protein FACS1894164_15710 [Spirochaetia bacterium]|nr:hypothetical protein FACS1894164_15710 [Spirochaetia bacterium]